MSSSAAEPLPEARRALDSLEPLLRDLIADRADVTRYAVHDGRVLVLEVKPRNQRACPVTVVGEQFLAIEIGAYGSRWELEYSDQGLEMARDLVGAVVAGRVAERFGFGRSRVTATLEDGTSTYATGYSGCFALLVPQRGWTRSGRAVQYAPYS